MSKNIQWSQSIIENLKNSGIQLFCVCPGARNAALIDVLSKQTDVELRYFVDERSAAFFALGRAIETSRPTVVCTTSGTAVAELLPATIEAQYVNAPLVLLTADRPRKYRGSGAPQAIDQLAFMKPCLQKQFDLEDGDGDFSVSLTGPSQVNICFEEPILGTPETMEEMESSLGPVGDKPLVIVGELSDWDRDSVRSFLQSRSGYFLAEAPSGLRGEKWQGGMQPLPPSLINANNFRDYFDSVVRIGSVPTLRLWRDLEGQLIDVPVLSFSCRTYSGLGRRSEPVRPLEKLSQVTWPEFSQEIFFKEKSEQWKARCEKLLVEFPNSELAMVSRLSGLIPENSSIFLSNSLPIREWDLVARDRPDLKIQTQRGVNGIDGLISTFLGRLHPQRENVLLIGDLSAIYDANAFWTWKQTLGAPKDIKVKVFVLNNKGGRIFRRLFENPALQSEHTYEFADYSQMFDWAYFCWKGISQMEWTSLPDQCLVELQPSLEESDRAWRFLT